MSDLTEFQRQLIDELANSISRLCHRVIARRLEQFFEVIVEEIAKKRAELLDALNRQPDESLMEWETRVLAARDSIREKS